ncbi:hypothetical protein [Pararobbsia alpina]|uniref:Uncharacterized protein n=1 Tax=Pararobbsia alpina TaxID=621374 RepID=A0A6S7BMT7_9BURK|nr:hypothetical protein [Pararobbsia alpina]CAB3806425.1 hypothetical protein LMG28138_05806 [Pararobbsia alpina]
MWEELQWFATVLGIAGAITNSVGGKLLRLTWPIWLAFSIVGIMVLRHLGAHGLLVQQGFYLTTTLIGGFRHFFPNAWRRLLGREGFLPSEHST